MDPALLKEREAFKKRSQATPVVEKKVSKAKVSLKDRPGGSSSKGKKKKSSGLSKLKPKRVIQTGTSDNIKDAALSGQKGNNPGRILKAIVDMMKERYLRREYDPLNFEEILTEINLSELRLDTRTKLYEELRKNPKLKYYTEVDRFIYLPALGHSVRNRRGLLEFLKDKERKGMGGVRRSDLDESMCKVEKVLQKLEDEIIKVTYSERNKEEILFYNNPEYILPMDESIISQWRQVSVEGHSEADIEKYLENVGLGAMQGEGRKRKAPTQQKKSSKKSRQTKILNTHLENDLLKEYSEDGTQLITPTT